MRAQPPRVDEAGQFPQLAAVGTDHEEHAADVVAAPLAWSGSSAMSTRIPPLRSTGHDRAGGPAHRVDHHVYVADVVLEPAGVVEDLIGAEPGDEFPVPRGRGSGHPGAVLGRELTDVGADAAGAAVDQDVLPGSSWACSCSACQAVSAPSGMAAAADGSAGRACGPDRRRGR